MITRGSYVHIKTYGKITTFGAYSAIEIIPLSLTTNNVWLVFMRESQGEYDNHLQSCVYSQYAPSIDVHFKKISS